MHVFLVILVKNEQSNEYNDEICKVILLGIYSLFQAHMTISSYICIYLILTVIYTAISGFVIHRP